VPGRYGKIPDRPVIERAERGSGNLGCPRRRSLDTEQERGNGGMKSSSPWIPAGKIVTTTRRRNRKEGEVFRTGGADEWSKHDFPAKSGRFLQLKSKKPNSTAEEPDKARKKSTGLMREHTCTFKPSNRNPTKKASGLATRKKKKVLSPPWELTGRPWVSPRTLQHHEGKKFKKRWD